MDVNKIVEGEVNRYIKEQTGNNYYTLYHGTKYNEFVINNKDIWLASDIEYAKIWGETK